MKPHLRIVDPGLCTTVQDLGRHGFQAMAVPVSGIRDSVSLRIGNAIVGNPDSMEGLEISMQGPTLEVKAESVRVVLCGTDAGQQPFPTHSRKQAPDEREVGGQNGRLLHELVQVERVVVHGIQQASRPGGGQDNQLLLGLGHPFPLQGLVPCFDAPGPVGHCRYPDLGQVDRPRTARRGC